MLTCPVRKHTLGNPLSGLMQSDQDQPKAMGRPSLHCGRPAKLPSPQSGSALPMSLTSRDRSWPLSQKAELAGRARSGR